MFRGRRKKAKHFDPNKNEVPLIVSHTLEHLHKHATNVEGVFRISGGHVLVDEMKRTYMKGKTPDLDKINDVHAVASCLKLFLRELEDPLLTFELYDAFVTSMETPADARVDCLRKVLSVLPPGNRAILTELMRFVHILDRNQSVTKMSASNLAIVFAPSILRPRDETPEIMLRNMKVTTDLVEYLIVNFDAISRPSAPVALKRWGAVPKLPLGLHDLAAAAATAHLPDEEDADEDIPALNREEKERFYRTLRRGTMRLAASMLQEEMDQMGGQEEGADSVSDSVDADDGDDDDDGEGVDYVDYEQWKSPYRGARSPRLRGRKKKSHDDGKHDDHGDSGAAASTPDTRQAPPSLMFIVNGVQQGTPDPSAPNDEASPPHQAPTQPAVGTLMPPPSPEVVARRSHPSSPRIGSSRSPPGSPTASPRRDSPRSPAGSPRRRSPRSPSVSPRHEHGERRHRRRHRKPKLERELDEAFAMQPLEEVVHHCMYLFRHKRNADIMRWLPTLPPARAKEIQAALVLALEEARRQKGEGKHGEAVGGKGEADQQRKGQQQEHTSTGDGATAGGTGDAPGKVQQHEEAIACDADATTGATSNGGGDTGEADVAVEGGGRGEHSPEGDVCDAAPRGDNASSPIVVESPRRAAPRPVPAGRKQGHKGVGGKGSHVRMAKGHKQARKSAGRGGRAAPKKGMGKFGGRGLQGSPRIARKSPGAGRKSPRKGRKSPLRSVSRKLSADTILGRGGCKGAGGRMFSSLKSPLKAAHDGAAAPPKRDVPVPHATMPQPEPGATARANVKDKLTAIMAANGVRLGGMARPHRGSDPSAPPQRPIPSVPAGQPMRVLPMPAAGPSPPRPGQRTGGEDPDFDRERIPQVMAVMEKMMQGRHAEVHAYMQSLDAHERERTMALMRHLGAGDM